MENDCQHYGGVLDVGDESFGSTNRLGAVASKFLEGPDEGTISAYDHA